MNNSKKFLSFVLVGLIFHVIYLFSIIDIYFKSPLIHVENQYRIPEDMEAVSNRVFFFVFDGATSDDFFPYGAPNLRRRYIDTGIGRWGISHTRVPTESRPCHVAMFGGFYEDPSSVTTGWTVNPVSYDSVIQQSEYSLLIGSGDVVELFSNFDHVEVHSYPMEMEDLASDDPSALDRWVEEKFKENVIKNPKTIQKLRSNKRYFIFLHFNGIDAAGHGYRPKSERYRNTIRYVDSAVDKIVDWIDHTFDDGKTTFIATSDHGMSMLGTHGGAEYGCTRTPFVAWGAGIPLSNEKKVLKIINDGRFKNDEEEVEFMVHNWKMSPEIARTRRDITQADITPLISSLLGIHVPMNNLGVVPLDYCCSVGFSSSSSSSSNFDEVYSLHALLANAEQINEQFRRFESLKSEEIRFGFSPFPIPSERLDECEKHERKGFDELLIPNMKRVDHKKVSEMIDNEEFQKVRCLLRSFMDWNLEGIRYYQQYHKYFLLTIISFGYASYIIHLLLLSSSTSTKQCTYQSVFYFVFGTLYSLFCMFLVLQNSPWMTFLYSFFPFYFSSISLPVIIHRLFRFFHFYSSEERGKVLFHKVPRFFFHLVLVEIITYGFLDRHVFAVGYFLLGLIRRSKWCFILGVFCLFPLNMGNQPILLVLGVLIFVLMMMMMMMNRMQRSTRKKSEEKKKNAKKLLILLNILAVVNAVVSDLQVIEPLITQSISWVLLSVSILYPFIFSRRSKEWDTRFELLISSFSIGYTLLTINYEMIFFSCFSIVLFEWIQNQKNDHHHHLNGSNNLLFLYFFISSFFVTGNLASFSSFQLSSVYRFVTALRPFVMSVLLVWKLLIPFLMVIISLMLIYRNKSAQRLFEKDIKKRKRKNLFLDSLYEIVAFCDVMSLTVLFLVKDTGSWLEIGNSISRFALTNLMLVLMLLMYCFGLLYVKDLMKNDENLNKEK